MKKHISNKEILIKFLLEKFEKSTSNKVSINKVDLPDIPLSEKDVIKTIYVLKEDGLLTITQQSPDDDFSIYWTVALKSGCIDYFKIKEESKIEKRNNWIQFWIPVSVSIAALVVSIVAII